MARRKDPVSKKLLVEGVHPVTSERTGAVTYRARASYVVGGKRYHASKTFKSADAATAWKLEKESTINKGRALEPTTTTADEYFEYWSGRLQRDWSGARHLSATQFWKRYGKPVIGDMRLQQITKHDIQHMVDLMADVLAPSSVRAYLATARSMFAAAEDDEIIDRTPVRNIRLPKPVETEQTIWSPLQLRRFLHGTKDHRFGHLWAFMIATGCRVSEAIALKRDSLWLDQGVARIWRTEVVNRRYRREVMDRVKSKSAGHRTRLEPWIVDLLRTLPENEYVFTENGKRLTYPTVLREFHIERKRLGLPEMTPHGIRHSVITMLSAEGIDIAVIKSIVGHLDVSTTADYVKQSPDAQRVGTEAAAKLLGFSVSHATTEVDSSASKNPGLSEPRQN